MRTLETLFVFASMQQLLIRLACEAVWIKRWVYQSVGSDLVAQKTCFRARMPMLFGSVLSFGSFVLVVVVAQVSTLFIFPGW